MRKAVHDSIRPQVVHLNRLPEPDHPVGGHSNGSSVIAEKLRRAILDGVYAYRERLPAERELAGQYGAARGTIRAALGQLEDLNLVSRRAGSGTFVRYRGHADHVDIAEVTSPLELIDVRLAVEPAMVRLAVLNANAQDLNRIREALEAVETDGTDPEQFSRCDEAYHLALAASARNPLMLWLYQHINDIRGHTQWSARKDKILTAERITQYNTQHRALFLAILSRDVEAAVQVINGHLLEARNDLLGVSG